MTRRSGAEIPTFGERQDGRTYRHRPGAYGVITDRAGRLAVVRTPGGSFLPGGGVEPGETHEAALRREVQEECGLEIAITRRLGEAVELVSVEGEGEVAKHGVFFAAVVCALRVHAGEPDHLLAWIDLATARTELKHGSQAWAVARALATPYPESPPHPS